jgi:PAS domain S-box-containing protein
MPDADRSSVELPLHLARSAFDAAPDAMLIVDMLGTIRHSNARVLELFGYRPDDLIGRSVEELLPERFRARDLDHLGRYAAHRRIRAMGAGSDLLGRRRDGSEFPLEISLSPVDDFGHPLVVAAIRDATAHKQLQDRLGTEAHESADLYNSAPCGYHSLDQHGVYLKINDTELAWIGCNRDDVIGKLSPADFYTEEGRIRFQSMFPEFLRAGHASGLEFDLIGRGGQRRHVAVSKIAVKDSSGRVLMTRGITFDISDRRVLEEALQRARDAALQANEVKSRFLAAASHDLRQPLQTIWSVQAMLSRVLQNSDCTPQLELLGEAVRNMDQMLSALVDINRLEQGAIRPVVRDFSLEEILPRLRSEFGYAASSKSIDLRIDGSAEFVRSDPMLLPVILRNLLGNAIKYTQRGRVELRVRVVDTQLFIDVADTGPGIAEEHLQRLFDAFYQVDNPTRDQGQGVGLGLSIVQIISRLLEHTVTIQSKSGAGSTFSVQMPRGIATDKPLEATPLAISRAVPRAAGVTVLHIEDDPGIARSMAMLLTLEGYKMVAAATRDEALQQINERGVRPDLILCDFNLPMGFTGDEIVSEITLALGYKPPTIMLTGDIADQHVKKARRVAERILPKPVDIALLLRDMTELLGQGAVGEEFAVYAREISVERPLETRCDGAFAELLTSSHLHLLEDHPHTVYGVWSDLTLAYVNPAWFAFARRNGADQSIPGGWSIGRSTIDAVPECLRSWYASFFSPASLTEGSAPRQHEYECSSADLHRRFLMKVYPLEGATRRGFIIVNTLRFEIPHVKMDRVAMPPLEKAYTDEAELMTQCVSCRRVRPLADASSWHWIPEWVRQVGPNVRHALCPACLERFPSGHP